MAEPWEERVVVALEQRLAGIKDTQGALTRPFVHRSHEIGKWLLRPKYPEIIALAPFEIEVTETPGLEHEETLILDVMLAAQHKENDSPFEEELPLRETRQYRLWRDFKRAILSEPTLDGLVSNVNFRQTILDARRVYFGEWAIVLCQIAPTHVLTLGES